MTISLSYTIRFVSNMNQAVTFHRDVLGLQLKFQSPEWSEFVTGETTLALHIASTSNPPGSVQLGFHVPDLQAFYDDLSARGIRFTQPPTEVAGSVLARFVDADGAEYSVSQARNT